jgi:hypothetical protein
MQKCRRPQAVGAMLSALALRCVIIAAESVE